MQKAIEKAGKVRDEAGLTRYLDAVEAEWEGLSVRISQLSYRRMVEKKPNPQIGALEAEMNQALLHEALAEVLAKFRGRLEDPRLRRRVECWETSLVTRRVEGDPQVLRLKQHLSDAIMGYSYPVRGQEHSISKIRHILRYDEDREKRREAWGCHSPLALELRPAMTDLYARRCQLARDEGYAHYGELALDIQGSGWETCRRLLTELMEKTQPVYDRVIEERSERLGLEQLAPWDLMYALQAGDDVPVQYFPKEKLTLRLEEFSALHGVSMSQLGIKPEYFDIPWNGVCLSVNHRKDMRIVCNPQDGFGFYGTMFHELGHGLHAVLNQQPEFIFSREPSPSNEGVANTFAYFTRYPQWLVHVGIPAPDVDGVLKGLLVPQLLNMRQRSAWGIFGFEVYSHPHQDLDEKLAETEHRIMGVSADTTPRWSADPWFIGLPSWHNYILAAMLASQMHRTLNQKFTPVYGNPDSVAFLAENYLRLGDLVPWQQKLKDCTGSTLRTTALVEDVLERAE